MKTCSGCGGLGPFYTNKTSKDGYTSRCRECIKSKSKEYWNRNSVSRKSQQKEYRKKFPDVVRGKRLREYGISLDTYNFILKSQNGGCSICGGPSGYPSGSFAVDHDHLTGLVRGLLCRNCNAGIGLFDDNPENIDKASAYLRKERN
jgi:hypothetical protein